MTMIVALTKEECHCSIFDFYDNVAANVGYFPTRNTRYDCQKICCSPEVQDEIFAHYRESDCNDAIVLPPYVHVLRAPSDVDVRVVDRNFTV